MSSAGTSEERDDVALARLIKQLRCRASETETGAGAACPSTHAKREQVDPNSYTEERLQALVDLGSRLACLSRVKWSNASWYPKQQDETEEDFIGTEGQSSSVEAAIEEGKRRGKRQREENKRREKKLKRLPQKKQNTHTYIYIGFYKSLPQL